MAEKLLSIMWRESRCNPGSVNQDDPNGGSLGLLQINQFWCRPNQYTDNGWLQDMGILDECLELYDPATNLRAGLAMYSYSVYKNANGWHPWRT
jgi:soluble lytic murein transglycosylase-like protein